MSEVSVDTYGNSVSTPAISELDEFSEGKDRISIMSGGDCPAPYVTFSEAPFPQCILAELLAMGFTKPTPVQMQGWSIAMQGRDLIGIARTGSGKTLAYLLPLITYVLPKSTVMEDSCIGPLGLVLAPTRELALQIQKEASRFAAIVNLRVTCCYGGAPRSPQLRDMSQGFEICIATPGRLIDFVNSKPSLLSRVYYLVLDEADRMLDMGFGPQIQAILSYTPKDKLSSLWSATFPKDIRELAFGMVCDPTRNPIHFVVGSDALTVNPDINQTVQFVDNEDDKRLELIRLLDEEGGRAIVFATTKVACEFICRELRYENFDAFAIHGDKHQSERDCVISQFRDRQFSILIATDVASRGLDIKDVPLIINYEMPTQMQDYVHRVGRTSRLGGSRGKAHTFITPGDGRFAKPLIKVLQDAKQDVPDSLTKLAHDYCNGKITYNGKKSSRHTMLSGSNTIPLRGTRNNRKRSFDLSTASCSGDECSGESARSTKDYLFAIDNYEPGNQLVEFVDLPELKCDNEWGPRKRSRSPGLYQEFKSENLQQNH